MDTSATEITFDDAGACSFCRDFEARLAHVVFEDPVHKRERLDGLVARVKADGRGKPYDCIVGVSGGVDSSWALVTAVELGLRPLAVHMDNGWNSELAQNNIANLVHKLKVDLHTHVINWQEYRGLMQAFFEADVIDIELLYDNAMVAVNYEQARKYRLHHILSGSNSATEGMAMPSNWNWFKRDRKNIVAIARRFGGHRLSTFPAIGSVGQVINQYGLGIKWVPFLDYIAYDKAAVLDALEAGYGYKRYPYKHYESIFTRFYQGFILPRKFGVDKRRLHLSSLIMSGQLSREEGLAALQHAPYPDARDEASDIAYFLKKVNWSQADLEAYLARPAVPHDHYPSEKWLWDLMFDMRRLVPRQVLHRLRGEA
jgi:N-acetyl sugar amidotransferase